MKPGTTRQYCLTLALLIYASATLAGTVVTPAGRQDGAVSPQPNALKVGNATVNWPDVILAMNDAQAATTRPPEALRFRNGDIWAGTVASLAKGQFVMDTASFEKRTVAADVIRAVDFRADLPPLDEEASGTLYRMTGKPVRGSMLWIEGERIAVNTPLGVIAMERKDLKRVVLEDATTAVPADAGTDQVLLVDGSLLNGLIEPRADGLFIKNANVGDRLIRPDQWQWIRRHPAKVVYLAETTPVSVKMFPLIRADAPAPRVELFRSGDGKAAPCAQRIYVWPKTVIAYQLPGQRGGKVSFNTVLGLTPGSRGAAHVQIRLDGRSVFDRTLEPEQTAPVVVAFEADGGSALELEADFDKTVRFPCSVTFDDVYVVSK